MVACWHKTEGKLAENVCLLLGNEKALTARRLPGHDAADRFSIHRVGCPLANACLYLIIFFITNC
jgi:hypothetical protein